MIIIGKRQTKRIFQSLLHIILTFFPPLYINCLKDLENMFSKVQPIKSPKMSFD